MVVVFTLTMGIRGGPQRCKLHFVMKNLFQTNRSTGRPTWCQININEDVINPVLRGLRTFVAKRKQGDPVHVITLYKSIYSLNLKIAIS